MTGGVKIIRAQNYAGVDTLKKAAELLVLRRDTFWVIDGAGPDARVKDRDGAASAPVNEIVREQETVQEGKQQHTTETGETVKEQGEMSESSNCTFSGVVPIDLKRFTERSVAVVECPGCSRTRSLSPSKEGILRFPPHKPRKMQTPVTGKRWSAKGKTDWDVVGGE
jgi:hypothetical protein